MYIIKVGKFYTDGMILGYTDTLEEAQQYLASADYTPTKGYSNYYERDIGGDSYYGRIIRVNKL